MISISNTIFYAFTFASVYVQVFFLLSFLENKDKIVTRTGGIKLGVYPTVTIIVPCWNEEKTIDKPIRSLLELDYPSDKIKILLVDDGPTAGTLLVMQKFAASSNIKIF